MGCIGLTAAVERSDSSLIGTKLAAPGVGWPCRVTWPPGAGAFDAD
jgi:hypothetical protein